MQIFVPKTESNGCLRKVTTENGIQSLTDEGHIIYGMIKRGG